MGTKPTKAAGNIYCKCRMEAAKYNEKLNSRAGAAELLGYGTSTVSGWELGTDRPSPEAVLFMADLYRAPELKNHYCRSVCPLGADSPELEVLELDRISIQALYSFRKIEQTKDALLDIAADRKLAEGGKIAETARPALEQILGNLEELEHVTQSLKLWIKKNL